VLLALASVTGPLVDLATHVIGSLGLVGVAVMTATTGVIGLPGTEPTMLFAGFNVYQGHLTLLGIIVFGVLGDMVGATIAYAIGYFGRRELLERQGSKLHVSRRKLQRAEAWSDRYGAPVIFASRMIPFARLAFPYAAGIAEMPFVRFAVSALLGSVVWITGLGLLGREVGSNWSTWRKHLEYVDYAVVVLILAAIAYAVYKRRRSPRTETSPEQEAASADVDTPVDVAPR
jgi:membrane protein DedA with SNARE-associated domain